MTSSVTVIRETPFKFSEHRGKSYEYFPTKPTRKTLSVNFSHRIHLQDHDWCKKNWAQLDSRDLFTSKPPNGCIRKTQMFLSNHRPKIFLKGHPHRHFNLTSVLYCEVSPLMIPL